MKNTRTNKKSYSLGDLIVAVTSCSKNSREAAAAISDLLESGRVRLATPGRRTRSKVC
ncbi:MAG TPA: hypothetical protein VF585_11195 [Chthoniobacterales bacterium]|jgi:hypothetical protein